MEADFIILPKENGKNICKLSMKQRLEDAFSLLYEEVQENTFQVNIGKSTENIEFKISLKSNMLFVKFFSDSSSQKTATVMDSAVNSLIQGEHRKDWNIIISYDEVSQYYCCKLMPFFGKFERRTREFVYLTIVKIFGVEWYEQSFEKNLKDDLKRKGKKVNKITLIEGALNELTYEQLNQYLFKPFSKQPMAEVIKNQFSEENIKELNKEEIISIIDNCRMVSLWDRFFLKYKQFSDFHEQIETLRPMRNKVMHNKRLKKEEYEQTKKKLNFLNKKLEEAITIIEDDLYTEINLTNVVSAFGKLLSSILGPSLETWTEQMSSALASFGKLAIEAATPQMKFSEILPELDFGVALTNQTTSPMPAFDQLNGVLNTSITASIKQENGIAEKFNGFKNIIQPNDSMQHLVPDIPALNAVKEQYNLRTFSPSLLESNERLEIQNQKTEEQEISKKESTEVVPIKQ